MHLFNEKGDKYLVLVALHITNLSYLLLKRERMPEDIKTFEILLDKVIDFTKTSLELFKLKLLAKFIDIVSSIIPNLTILLLVAVFLFFLNLGIAFFLGEALGKIYLGFLILSVFYLIVALAIRILFFKQIKRYVGNYFLKVINK